jgi:hypothetical protein
VENYAIHARGAHRQLVVAARPEGDVRVARSRLKRMALAHRIAGYGLVPRVVEVGESEGVPFVAFDARAEADFQTIMDAIVVSSTLWPYAKAIAWIEQMFAVLGTARDCSSWFTGLSWANIVVTPEGDLRFIGLGDNVLAYDDDGHPRRSLPVFSAPEVVAGAPGSPAGDLHAFALATRTLLMHVDFPASVVRTEADCGVHPELVDLYKWISLNVLAPPPQRRAMLVDAWERERRAWRLLDVRPDRDGFRALMRRLAFESVRRLVVDPDGVHIVVPSGKRRSLRNHRSLRRIMAALVNRHRAGPDQVLPLEELVAAGWPGEKLRRDDMANRAYLALSSLRRLGLDEVVERHDGGWRLSPRVLVRVEPTY